MSSRPSIDPSAFPEHIFQGINVKFIASLAMMHYHQEENSSLALRTTTVPSDRETRKEFER